jgi:tetratricopeptide (TPR) repeat protein
MRGLAGALCAVLAVGTGLFGCATSDRSGGDSLRQASQPAWSLKLSPPRLVVAVSPVRQTLQIAGSIGTVIGAGITAVQNANYKNDIEEALGGYDTVQVIESESAEAIAVALGKKGEQVAPFDKNVEGMSIREAAHRRYRQLAKAGHDQVLDVAVTHGVYGAGGELVVRLHAELHAVPSGKVLWKDTITFRGGEALAFRSLGDPTGQLKPNITSPRLSSKAGAVSQWTENGAARFKTEFERALTCALAGMQVSLGGPETVDGLFALGADLMYQKKFAEAHERLEKARLLARDRTDIANTEAVNLGHNGQVDDAIALSKLVVEAHDDDFVSNANLAWWYAVEKNQPELARPYYDQALKLGMAPVKKLDRALTP